MNNNDGARSSLFGNPKKSDGQSNLSDSRGQVPLTEMDELKKKLKILLVAREQLKQQNDELTGKVSDYERRFDKIAEENQANTQKYHEAISQKSFYMNLYQSLQKKNEELEQKIKEKDLMVSQMQAANNDRFVAPNTHKMQNQSGQYDMDVNETSLQLGKIILDAQISASQIKKRAKEDADKFYRETVDSLVSMLAELRDSKSNLNVLKGNLNNSVSVFNSCIEEICSKIDTTVTKINDNTTTQPTSNTN